MEVLKAAKVFLFFFLFFFVLFCLMYGEVVKLNN